MIRGGIRWFGMVRGVKGGFRILRWFELLRRVWIEVVRSG